MNEFRMIYLNILGYKLEKKIVDLILFNSFPILKNEANI